MKIAIIGGGISGLTCATLLNEQGHETTVFEKARGAGGRMSTRRTEWGGIDHGAQFFTIRDETFRTFLNEKIGAEYYQEWSGKLAILNTDGSLSDDTHEPRYAGTPGMNAICKELANNVNFKRATRVAAIEKENVVWHLKGEEENTLGYFDWVISSAPPKQTAELFGSISELSTTLDAIDMGPCVSVLLMLKEKVEFPYDGIKCNHPMLGWVANNFSKPSRTGNSLMIQSNYEWTQHHINEAPELLGEKLIKATEEAFDFDLSDTLYKQAHRWLYAAPSKGLNQGFYADEANQLAAIGDWCLSGRVEGAFLSALAITEELSK